MQAQHEVLYYISYIIIMDNVRQTVLNGTKLFEEKDRHGARRPTTTLNCREEIEDSLGPYQRCPHQDGRIPTCRNRAVMLYIIIIFHI